jgi:hypothetical protein
VRVRYGSESPRCHARIIHVLSMSHESIEALSQGGLLEEGFTVNLLAASADTAPRVLLDAARQVCRLRPAHKGRLFISDPILGAMDPDLSNLCPSIRGWLRHITVDGQVTACQHDRGGRPLAATVDDLQREISLPNRCARCVHLKACGGGCYARYGHDGDVLCHV